MTPVSTVPKDPVGDCRCTSIVVSSEFSPGALLKCENCIDVFRSKDQNSCPAGTKLFSPRSRADWEAFINSATPLRDPNFIIDVTRPLDADGAPFGTPMNFDDPVRRTFTRMARDGTNVSDPCTYYD